jgi:uncharacterized phage protein (TIGR01671 family)
MKSEHESTSQAPLKRKIKFRIWDRENKQFLPENLRTRGVVLNRDGEIILLTNQGPYPYPVNGGMDRFEIQQYIGLEDKNGKEIYEGDILSWSEYQGWEDGRTFRGRYVVRWNEDCLRWDFHDPDVDDSLEAGNTKFDGIIGNIFETPINIVKEDPTPCSLEI